MGSLKKVSSLFSAIRYRLKRKPNPYHEAERMDKLHDEIRAAQMRERGLPRF